MTMAMMVENMEKPVGRLAAHGVDDLQWKQPVVGRCARRPERGCGPVSIREPPGDRHREIPDQCLEPGWIVVMEFISNGIFPRKGG